MIFFVTMGLIALIVIFVSEKIKDSNEEKNEKTQYAILTDRFQETSSMKRWNLAGEGSVELQVYMQMDRLFMVQFVPKAAYPNGTLKSILMIMATLPVTIGFHQIIMIQISQKL